MLRDVTGEYTWAWFGAAALCVVAAVVSVGIARKPASVLAAVGGAVLDLEAVLTIALFIGVVTLGLQVADAVSSVIDARSVRDDDEPDRLTRTRMRELTWTIAVTAALAVFVAFGVDSAARLVWDEDRPLIGAIVLRRRAGRSPSSSASSPWSRWCAASARPTRASAATCATGRTSRSTPTSSPSSRSGSRGPTGCASGGRRRRHRAAGHRACSSCSACRRS